MATPKLKIKKYLYCVVLNTGHLCLWSLASNRSAAWQAFTDGEPRVSIEQAKKKGARCVRVRLISAEVEAGQQEMF